MRAAIFGATGGIGVELVRQALERGHSVTAFVRDPTTLTGKGDDLMIMTGDIFDSLSVTRCDQGQDAALCALGARELKKTMVNV